MTPATRNCWVPRGTSIRRVTVNMGMSMPSWFDINSLEPELFKLNPPGLKDRTGWVGWGAPSFLFSFLLGFGGGWEKIRSWDDLGGFGMNFGFCFEGPRMEGGRKWILYDIYIKGYVPADGNFGVQTLKYLATRVGFPRTQAGGRRAQATCDTWCRRRPPFQNCAACR